MKISNSVFHWNFTTTGNLFFDKVEEIFYFRCSFKEEVVIGDHGDKVAIQSRLCVP